MPKPISSTGDPGSDRSTSGAGPPSRPLTTDRLIGEVLAGRYRVLRRLGAGGMGVVYVAEHVHLGRLVALKLLLPDAGARPELVERFLREARAAAAAQHENVVDVTDFGRTPDGQAFFVMELLEGQTLGARIRKGPLLVRKAIDVGEQICRGLAAFHARHIVHRDLKGENVFLVRRNEREIVKLLDFGIAKIVGDATPRERLTRVGAVVGTAEYMAPEQVRGQVIDERTDLYATGCLLYEMLTGRPPFVDDSPLVVLSQHIYAEVVPPSRRVARGTIPPPLEAVVLRALAKDPAQRYASAREMGAALAKCRPSLTPVAVDVVAVARRPTPLQALAELRVAEENDDMRRAFVAAERAVSLLAGGLASPTLAPFRELLERTYRAACGSLDRRVEVRAGGVPPESRAAFLLSRADGELTLQDLIDVSGMPDLEALRLVAQLVQSGALVPRDEAEPPPARH